LITNRVEILAP